MDINFIVSLEAWLNWSSTMKPVNVNVISEFHDFCIIAIVSIDYLHMWTVIFVTNTLRPRLTTKACKQWRILSGSFLFPNENLIQLCFRNYFLIFIRIVLNQRSHYADKESVKKERSSEVQGCPPQSFLSVPRLDIAYPVHRSTSRRTLTSVRKFPRLCSFVWSFS